MTMKDIESFLKKYPDAVDYSNAPMNPDDLAHVQLALDLRFGPELKAYLLKYGYLGCMSVELYGMNTRQGMRSDMIRQTQYLHQHFPLTRGYIALGDWGEGDYILLDSYDNVFRYRSEENKLENLREKMADYILRIFGAEVK